MKTLARMRRLPVCLGIAVLIAPACSGHGDDFPSWEQNTVESELLGSSFESTDGNLTVDGLMDWANAPNLRVGIDLPPGNTDNAFGQGSKEDDEVPTVVLGSIPPNKSDLSRMYIADEELGPDTHFLYLAWERFNTLGTANMDFELNQSTAISENDGTNVRWPGDILITYDLVNGGTVPVLGILEWVTSANGTAADCFANNSLPCWGFRQDLSASGIADGAVNTTTVIDPIADPDITLEHTGKGPRFGEAAVNLTATAAVPKGGCWAFAGARLTSRSSASFTAELKDYIGPVAVDISNCEPVTIEVHKVDPSGAPLKDAVMELYQDDGDGVLDPAYLKLGGAGDLKAANNCTTAVDGTCTFTVLINGTYIIHEASAPEGYGLAPDQKVTVTPGDTPQTIVMTFVDYPKHNRIDILKLDDSGQPLDGATFTLYPDNAPAAGVMGSEDTAGTGHPTCTTDKTGQCSFQNLGHGSFWVAETGTPPGYVTSAVPSHVILDGAGTPELPQTASLVFVNELILGTINLDKRDQFGNPVPGAEFVLYQDLSPVGGAPDSSDTAGTGYASCTTDKQGQCTFSEVPLGGYWLVETGVPTGYIASGSLHQQVTVHEGTAPGQGHVVSVVFTNQLVVGVIYVQKYDPTGGMVSGVEYTLYPDNAPTLGTPGFEDTGSGTTFPICVTDKLGACWFLDVPLGSWWVVETYTPKGVVAANPPHQPALIGPGPAPGEGDLVMLTF